MSNRTLSVMSVGRASISGLTIIVHYGLHVGTLKEKNKAAGG